MEIKPAIETFAKRIGLMLAGFLLTLLVPQFTYAQNISIQSDSSWRVSGALTPGWEQPVFDDSLWESTISPALVDCGGPFPGDPVKTMWSITQHPTVFFRKTFTLASLNDVASASLQTISDDDHDLYINGLLVAQDRNSVAGPLLTTDIKPYLTQGANLIAITAQDVPGGCRWMWVKGEVVLSTKDPVILIPGIVGSRLNRDDGSLEEIWPNVGKMIFNLDEDEYLNELIMLNTGDPDPSKPIVATDVIRSELTRVYFRTLIEELANNGYQEGIDLFVFPYDWRIDIEDTAQALDQKVQDVLNQTGANKVDIIAHSQGGLVSKLYASSNNSANIDQLVLVGVPQLGAPKAFKILSYGDNLGFVFVGIDILSSQRIKTITQNMPAIYQLLPSRQYFNPPLGTPYVFDFRGPNGGALDYDSTNAFMTQNPQDTRNPDLLTLADQFHESLDAVTSLNARTYLITGCGNEDTIGSFRVYDHDKVDIDTTDGDGTVPFHSALGGLSADKRYFVLSHDARYDHVDLVRAAEPLQQIVNILNGDLDAPVNNISQSIDDCAPESPALTRFLFSTHSPVNLHVYDSLNNHVGATTTGDIDLQIPNSRFEEILDNDFAFVPPNDTYRLEVNAISTGAFDLKIRTLRGTTTQDLITYINVPVDSPNSTAELFFTRATDNLTLLLDQDGDGTKETQIQPTAILNNPTTPDITPPTTTAALSGTAGMNNWFIGDVTVTLTAMDDPGGIGVHEIKYSLDDGLTFQTYSGSFIMSKEGSNTVIFQSVDKLGNLEPEQSMSINIDKTPPEAEIFFDPLINQMRVTGTDNLTPVQIMQLAERIFLLTDEAGHALHVRFNEFNNLENGAVASIKQLAYNSSPVEVRDNRLTAASIHRPETEQLSLLQSLHVAHGFSVNAVYSPIEDETRIVTKYPDEPIGEQILQGRQVVILKTHQGSLDFEIMPDSSLP